MTTLSERTHAESEWKNGTLTTEDHAERQHRIDEPELLVRKKTEPKSKKNYLLQILKISHFNHRVE